MECGPWHWLIISISIDMSTDGLVVQTHLQLSKMLIARQCV